MRTVANTIKLKKDLLTQRYEGWFCVLIAVLMALAAVLFSAMMIWCMVNGHGTFTGNYGKHGVDSMNIQCAW